MKRTVWTFGIIAGLIISVFILVSVPYMKKMTADSVATSMFVGYAVQLLTFSLIFFAIRQYRDKYHGGVISFGKAFQVGLWVALIGSTFYVITWAIAYHTMIPDFMDIWERAQIEGAMKKNASATEIANIREQVAEGKKMYNTWYGFVGFTLFEILPTGLLVSLICALILKRRKVRQLAG